MIQERTPDTFLATFKFLLARKGMSPYRFVEHINAQPLPDDLKEHTPYRHIAPLNRSTISRILSGSVPDPDTLYRIARLGFELDKTACDKLEDIRYEASLLSLEERRTTQQMAVVRKEPEVKTSEKEGDKLPAWIFL